MTLFFTSPVLATLMERALLPADPQSPFSAAGCLLTVAGALLVAQPSASHVSHRQAAGITLALTAAACNAGAFVTIRAIGQGPASATLITFWYHCVVLATSCCFLMAGWPAAPVLPDGRACLLLACVSAAQLVGQVLLNRGFQLVSCSLAGMRPSGIAIRQRVRLIRLRLS